MLSARAAVRAHVTANQGEADDARAYLAAATRHLAPPPPALTAIGGLSGTGKTTLARRIAPRLGGAPGAVVLRSDEIRKRLAGAAPTERLPPAAYGPGTSERVYAEMLALGRRVLAAGRSVVLDAVFLRPEERSAAAAVAGAAGVPFQGAWLQGDPAALNQRLAGRAGDASDAGPETLATQLARDPGPIDWAILDADDLGAAVARLAPQAPEN
jgi:predicted kinase